MIPPHFLIPPIPDYPSARRRFVGGRSGGVDPALSATSVSFEATSVSLPGVTRRYSGFTQAAKETGMSRVYGGIHFLHAVRDGYRQGKGVGAEVSEFLPKVPRRQP